MCVPGPGPFPLPVLFLAKSVVFVGVQRRSIKKSFNHRSSLAPSPHSVVPLSLSLWVWHCRVAQILVEKFFFRTKRQRGLTQVRIARRRKGRDSRKAKKTSSTRSGLVWQPNQPFHFKILYNHALSASKEPRQRGSNGLEPSRWWRRGREGSHIMRYCVGSWASWYGDRSRGNTRERERERERRKGQQTGDAARDSRNLSPMVGLSAGAHLRFATAHHRVDSNHCDYPPSYSSPRTHSPLWSLLRGRCTVKQTHSLKRCGMEEVLQIKAASAETRETTSQRQNDR